MRAAGIMGTVGRRSIYLSIISSHYLPVCGHVNNLRYFVFLWEGLKLIQFPILDGVPLIDFKLV